MRLALARGVAILLRNTRKRRAYLAPASDVFRTFPRTEERLAPPSGARGAGRAGPRLGDATGWPLPPRWGADAARRDEERKVTRHC